MTIKRSYSAVYFSRLPPSAAERCDAQIEILVTRTVDAFKMPAIHRAADADILAATGCLDAPIQDDTERGA
jgi:hypothetical protein